MSPLDYVKDLYGQLLTSKCLNAPIFIVGAGRSGTSILLQSLGKHPDILSFPGEAPFLTSIGGNASLYDPELNKDNADYYRNSLKFDLDYFYNLLSKIGIEAAGGKHYGLINILKSTWNNKSFRIKKHWSAKTAPTEKVAYGLLNVYPNAKFIYIIRNGIDVVHSRSKFHGFCDNEFQHHCQTWSNSITKYRYLIRHDKVLCVRHENLLSEPVVFFNKIFDFLNLEYTNKCTEYVYKTLVHPLDEHTQSDVNAIERIKNRESPFNTWTTEQKNLFVSICGEAMTEMNYEIA